MPNCEQEKQPNSEFSSFIMQQFDINVQCKRFDQWEVEYNTQVVMKHREIKGSYKHLNRNYTASPTLLILHKLKHCSTDQPTLVL